MPLLLTTDTRAAVEAELKKLRDGQPSTISDSENAFISGAVRECEWFLGIVDRPASQDIDP